VPRYNLYPAAELDAAAPQHPVMFSTGPDAMLNTLALQEAGIDKNYKPAGEGIVEKDRVTGEPTGLIRSVSVKTTSSSKSATEAEQLDRLEALFRDYSSVGLTTVADRNSTSSAVRQFAELKAAQRLPVRMRVSYGVDAGGRLTAIQNQIGEIARHPLRQAIPASVISIALDSGMLITLRTAAVG
jgi:predicted amidohydrolase YtcJ